jgi:hypothetical protein
VSSLPPSALEVTPEGLVIPVEAPPCGQTLDIPEKGIHLVCDRPAGHQVASGQGILATRHRQIIQRDPPHGVGWCDDHCGQPCEPLSGVLDGLREQGLEVRHGRA